MTRAQYESYALDIQRQRCIQHEGRTASTLAELDWIYKEVYGGGNAGAKGEPKTPETEKKVAPAKAPAKPKAAAKPATSKPKASAKPKAEPIVDSGAPVFADVDGERTDLSKLSESALLELADRFGIPGADAMAAGDLVAAVKAMADKAGEA